MAVVYWNHVCAEVQKTDCTVPVHRSPGLGRTINLDSKLLNIQTKEKWPSWTHKRNRTSFSAEFRELWREAMGREARGFSCWHGLRFQGYSRCYLSCCFMCRAPIITPPYGPWCWPRSTVSTSVIGFPVQAESTPRQVLGDQLMLHISELLRADKGVRGVREGKNHRAEEKISFKWTLKKHDASGITDANTKCWLRGGKIVVNTKWEQ